jgi:hypothetical protein
MKGLRSITREEFIEAARLFAKKESKALRDCPA